MIVSKLKNKLKHRNQFFIAIRAFFKDKNILEVDTPILRRFSVTDPYMNALSVINPAGESQGYLQTSPEHAMKKLLCAGSGDIFQLGKMFRADECGKIHALEFTLLEWYRIGLDHFQLMDEVAEFVQKLVGKKTVKKITYQDAFISLLGFDPFDISIELLTDKTEKLLGELPNNLLFDNYLSLLFSEIIEPSFDPNTLVFIYGYPESQASLAKTRQHKKNVIADRFEVYLGGMELANGFNELTDVAEHRQRFTLDNQIRRQLNYAEIEMDHDFINALEQGLPQCAGVALGVDRLLMIQQNAKDINDVLS